MKKKKSTPKKIKESYINGWQRALSNQEVIEIEAIRQDSAKQYDPEYDIVTKTKHS